jgi:uncharacterized caspase-like protein
VSFSASKQRLALLIGNGNYKHGGRLANPVNDVRAMKTALEGLGFTVFKYENCSQRDMKEAMDEFGSKLKGRDVGLFFYAGHGVQVSGYNYLIPVDANLSNEKKVEYDCVKADRILADMEHAGVRTSVVILDACRFAALGEPPGPEKVEKVPLLSEGGASFDDILKAGQEKKQAMERWSAWQAAREKEYGQVEEIDRSEYLTPEQKKAA